MRPAEGVRGGGPGEPRLPPGPTRARLFSARYLLPIGEPLLEDGALLAEGGRIRAVGPLRELREAAPGAEPVDFGDAVLLPPLVNAHTHLELTRFPRWLGEDRNPAPPPGFLDWILRVVRVKGQRTSEEFAASVREGMRLCLAAGTGAVGEILSCLPAAGAYRDSPLRGRLFLETLGVDPERWRPHLRRVEEEIGELPPGGPLRPGLAPHAPYTLSPDHLAAVAELAARRGLPISLHLAESREEEAFVRTSSGPLAEELYPRAGWARFLPPAAGASPVAAMADLGLLGPGTLLVHGVRVSPADVGIIAGSGATVVLCPRSNARLGVGRAPLEAYLGAGVPLALGTDSLASCDSLSVWDEIAFARRWFGPAAGPGLLLEAATAGGARALGLEGEMGRLKAGWGAHFQVLRPAELPVGKDLAEYLCGPGRSGEVDLLFLDGEQVC